jgi:ABC-type transport system involved in cytochrome c biogenesis permease subunit
LGAVVVVFVVLTRDPADPISVGAVIAGASAVAAGVMGRVALGIEERWAGHARLRRSELRRRRVVRRALGFGAIVAALALLRAVDGLTIVTGGFVIAGFALAELVLAARPAAPSG